MSDKFFKGTNFSWEARGDGLPFVSRQVGPKSSEVVSTSDIDVVELVGNVAMRRIINDGGGIDIPETPPEPSDYWSDMPA